MGFASIALRTVKSILSIRWRDSQHNLALHHSINSVMGGGMQQLAGMSWWLPSSGSQLGEGAANALLTGGALTYGCLLCVCICFSIWACCCLLVSSNSQCYVCYIHLTYACCTL